MGLNTLTGTRQWDSTGATRYIETSVRRPRCRDARLAPFSRTNALTQLDSWKHVLKGDEASLETASSGVGVASR